MWARDTVGTGRTRKRQPETLIASKQNGHHMRRFWKHQREIWPRTKDPRPALFVEMRLGKTLLTIRRVKTYAPTIRAGLLVLVVGPYSVLDGWRKELEEEGERRVFSLSGTGEQREKEHALAVNHANAGERVWVLINREGYRVTPGVLRATAWDCVILDESTFIKNPRARITKFFTRNFRTVSHRWCLTGMPMPENPLDVVPQMMFLHGEWMGCLDFWQWRNRYAELVGYRWEIKTGSLAQFNHALARDSIIVRRSDVGMDKERIYQTRVLDLPQELRETYDRIEGEFVLAYKNRARTETTMQGTRLSWMRDACNGIVDGRYVWDGKVKEIVSLLQGELKGQSVVIWVDRLNLIVPLCRVLHRRGIRSYAITGGTPQSQRRMMVGWFQDHAIQVLICQAQCATFGMDLSTASVVIYMDSVTSGLVRRQTEDRILAIDKGGPLLYIDLIVGNTISQDYYSLIRAKNAGAASGMDLVKEIQERKGEMP